jgi:hypothetical protein
MLTHALLASLPLVLIAATIVTVHSLPRLVLVAALAVAAMTGARGAAALFRLMLAERSRTKTDVSGIEVCARASW